MEELERRDYFPTMIFQGQVSEHREINPTIIDFLYAARDEEARVDGSDATKPGIWRSAKNLHRNPDFDPLQHQIQAALESMAEQLRYSKEHLLKITAMWGTIKPAGSGARAECRPGNLWTGCYGVQVPQGTGSMKFVDPRTINIMNPPKYDKGTKPRGCLTKVDFKPAPGRFAIFPAWLYQEVESNLSQVDGRAGDYVYISFNVIQKRKS